MSTTTSDNSQIQASTILHRRWQNWLWLVTGVLLGALLILGIRFVTYHPTVVHYHANFAVYINGSREEFKSPEYYQEVQICSLNGATPESRAHMHEPDNGVIHIHDAAVTWGQFFENLGWFVGPDFIRTQTTMYQEDATNKLNIILNGQNLTDLTTITDQVIQDKDRLLLSYGPADAALLQSQYKTVPDNAAHYDETKDPASCAGADAVTLSARLHHLF
jgi:hypothetical protein